MDLITLQIVIDSVYQEEIEHVLEASAEVRSHVRLQSRDVGSLAEFIAIVGSTAGVVTTFHHILETIQARSRLKIQVTAESADGRKTITISDAVKRSELDNAVERLSAAIDGRLKLEIVERS